MTQWDPRTRTLLATVPIPAPRVTSVAFGGAQLNTLYVTTARVGLDAAALAQAPEAGSIFRVDGTGATGVPSTEYAH